MPLHSTVSEFLLLVVFILIAAIVGVLLDHFGNRKTFPWYVQATCFVSYFFPFTIILVLPIDLVSTRYRECSTHAIDVSDCDEPLVYVSENFLYQFWQIVYWITFNIQMFIVPIMQGYVRSGELSFIGRLNAGIMENVVFYAMCGGIGLVFILYAIFGLHIPTSDLITLAIPAANAYGLLLLTVLMGYGLVEVPRGLWFNSDVTWVLKHLETKAPQLKEACVDSEAEIYEVARLVGHASRKIQSGDPLRELVDKLVEKCPLALQERNFATDDDDLPPTFTRASLIDLNARISRATFLNVRDQALLRYLEHQAFLCQDIISNSKSTDKRFKSVFFAVPDSDKYKDLKLQIFWWWFVWIKPVSMRILCGICVIASVLIVWSESTFQISSVVLSIPQLILQPGNISYGALEILAIAFVCYMCTCTYSTLLNLNLFDYYKMVPEHHTDEVSMLFVGAYLCKLTFPLCYNFLNMGGLADGKPSNSTGTSADYSMSPVFIQYLGPAVNLTPLFGAGYNDWVAHLVLIMCCIILLNLHGRILRIFNLDAFVYESLKRETPAMEEGRGIIAQARPIEERRILRGGNDGHGHGESSRLQGRARNARELLASYRTRQDTPASANLSQLNGRGTSSQPATGNITAAATAASRTSPAASRSTSVSPNKTATTNAASGAQGNPARTGNLLAGFNVAGLFGNGGSGTAGTSRGGYQRMGDGGEEPLVNINTRGGLHDAGNQNLATQNKPASGPSSGRPTRKFGVGQAGGSNDSGDLFATSTKSGGNAGKPTSSKPAATTNKTTAGNTNSKPANTKRGGGSGGGLFDDL